MKLKDIIKQAIDIHVHIGPEIIPRKYTVENLIKAEAGKIAGFVLKNHFYPTQPLINEIKYIKGMKMFGGIVLNNAVGGINVETIYASSLLTDKPIMVWLPTINAENFLRKSDYEIAPEWVEKKGFSGRKSKDVEPVFITKKNKLLKKAIDVLKMIKKCNSILATGHISWRESKLLIEQALKIGIKRIVITHPIYQCIRMPINIQRELANKGCLIEQSYSMYSMDKIPIKQIAEQIQAVGSKNVILSSDVGQSFSPPPSIALNRFGLLLKKKDISENDLYKMMVINPKKLLGIE